MKKTIDLINALNEHEFIKNIITNRDLKVAHWIKEYELRLSENRPDLAYDIKKYINWLWEEKDKEILKYKEDYLLKELEQEHYARKLDYMINGCGIVEMFNDVFAKQNLGSRGYVIISQHDEERIKDEFHTMKDLSEMNDVVFVVYRCSELDLNKNPILGKVLYKIGPNGLLRRLKANYDSSD